MNDDSELQHIRELGQKAIEDNLWQIYNELGSPTFGNMTWEPRRITSSSDWKIMGRLGLYGVPYPYPSGSWYDWFDYVQTDPYVRDAGYRKCFGYLTLMNYWLQEKPMHHETPDLWKTSEQPITALKNAVSLFLDYVEMGDQDDRVALAVYTASDGTALLEQELTHNFDLVDNLPEPRQLQEPLVGDGADADVEVPIILDKIGEVIFSFQ